MADQTTRDGSKQRDRGEFTMRMIRSFMTPIAAAAASAAAGYAARKAPALVERKVLPKLRDLAGDAGGAAQDLPAKAKSVASGAGDVAQDLGERAKSFVTSSNGHSRRPSRSAKDIARRQDERAKARAERRKTRR